MLHFYVSISGTRTAREGGSLERRTSVPEVAIFSNFLFPSLPLRVELFDWFRWHITHIVRS